MFLTKTIKVTEVEMGDFIKTRCLGHENRYRTVVNTMRPTVTNQVELVIDGTYSVCVSNIHPIAIVRDEQEQYIPTEEAVVGDLIITPEGYKPISLIRQGNYDTEFVDFTVDEDNNYYAGNRPDSLILAHNSATLYYPLWHLEVEDLLVLKNNKGTEDNRIRHMDYSVQFNRVMYERLLSGGKITLFSPSDVPGLYDAFFEDTDKFRQLYEKYEADRRIRKKSVDALELFSQFIQERKDTGRIYLMNVDHCNDHGSFKKDIAPVRQSNLCGEITLPTKPLNNISDEQGRIQLCTLAAINWGKIKKPEDFERPCTLVVRALDNILSYQNYPVKAAEIATREHRPLGVGIINFAYWLAKNDTTYQQPNLELVHKFTEAWSYYLIKASVDLAEELGACERADQTLYADGIMPIDTYKKDVDTLTDPVYYMDWDKLREKAKLFGIRNATVMALMPAESSALVSNSTNGIEPPRSLVSIKQSKEAIIRQVVPGIHKLKNKYDLLWDQKSPEGYLKICAVLQKFIDQAISVNTSYNLKFYPDEQIPLSDMLNDIVLFYKMGGKLLYYNNTNDGATDELEELPRGELDSEADCDGCVL